MRISDFPMILEVRDSYIDLRKSGSSRRDAVREMCEKYAEEITLGASDDGLLFWIGLADGQSMHKELTLETAEQALRALDGLSGMCPEILPGDISRRKEKYLAAPMPEHKFGKPRKKFRCCWENGDTFAYRLTGPEADMLGVNGQYILLRKVSEQEQWDGRLLPVVTLALWERDVLPQSREDLLTATCLKIARGRMGLPGNKYEYRTELIIKNQKELDSTPLVYLGKYENLPMPADEVVVERAGCIILTRLETIADTLCTRVRLSRHYEAEKGVITSPKGELIRKT